MPFIMSKVNVPVDAAQEVKLKSRLGKAIELLPGLSEKYLLAGFESDCRFYLRGDKNQPSLTSKSASSVTNNISVAKIFRSPSRKFSPKS